MAMTHGSIKLAWSRTHDSDLQGRGAAVGAGLHRSSPAEDGWGGDEMSERRWGLKVRSASTVIKPIDP